MFCHHLNTFSPGEWIIQVVQGKYILKSIVEKLKRNSLALGINRI